MTRLPQTPLELPASLTVIDRRMIEASGVNDIPELQRNGVASKPEEFAAFIKKEMETWANLKSNWAH